MLDILNFILHCEPMLYHRLEQLLWAGSTRARAGGQGLVLALTVPSSWPVFVGYRVPEKTHEEEDEIAEPLACACHCCTTAPVGHGSGLWQRAAGCGSWQLGCGSWQLLPPRLRAPSEGQGARDILVF